MVTETETASRTPAQWRDFYLEHYGDRISEKAVSTNGSQVVNIFKCFIEKEIKAGRRQRTKTGPVKSTEQFTKEWMLDVQARTSDILDLGQAQAGNVMDRYKDLLKVLGHNVNDDPVLRAARVDAAKFEQANLFQNKKCPCTASTPLMIHAFQYWHCMRPFCSEALFTLFAIEMRLCIRGAYYYKTELVDAWPQDVPQPDLPAFTGDFAAYRLAFHAATNAIMLDQGACNYLVLLPDRPAVFVVQCHKQAKNEHYRRIITLSPELTEYVRQALVAKQDKRFPLALGGFLMHPHKKLAYLLHSVWGSADRKGQDAVGVDAVRRAKTAESKFCTAEVAAEMCLLAGHRASTALGIYDREKVIPPEHQLALFDKSHAIPTKDQPWLVKQPTLGIKYHAFSRDDLYAYEHAKRWIKHALIEDETWADIVYHLKDDDSEGSEGSAEPAAEAEAEEAAVVVDLQVEPSVSLSPSDSHSHANSSSRKRKLEVEAEAEESAPPRKRTCMQQVRVLVDAMTAEELDKMIGYLQARRSVI